MSDNEVYPIPRLHAVARDAAAAGLSGLTVAQLDGEACVRCRRESPAMEPLKGFFGGQQLFECETGDPRGCRSNAYEPGALVLVRDQYQPLNPIPAVVELAVGDRVRVRYRDSAMVAWIDSARIIGRDTRAAQVRDDR